MRSWNLILAAAFLIVCAGTVSAQPSSSRWTLGGTGGAGRTWDDEGQIGGGLLAGGFARWRWLSRTDLEASLDLLTHNRTGGSFEAKGHTTFVTAAIVQRFGRDSVNGNLLVGVTLAAHSGTAGFPRDQLVVETHSTHPGYIFGGGLMFRASRRVSVEPLVRLAMLTAKVDSDPWSAMMGGVRIGFR
jgi:hypothetical protein